MSPTILVLLMLLAMGAGPGFLIGRDRGHPVLGAGIGACTGFLGPLLLVGYRVHGRRP